MAFGLAYDKLWSVHLNDQNGLKFDQDRSFGAVNLRRAFDQVLVLDDHRFWGAAWWAGCKAVRTPEAESLKHLSNSLELFLWLVERVRNMDRSTMRQLIGRATTGLDR